MSVDRTYLRPRENENGRDVYACSRAGAARSPRPRAATLLLGLVLGGSGCFGGPDLSLRRVVLYQNGIGYFERSGEISQPSYRLRLRRHEIDDVLKTLVVIDETAGKEQRPITAVVPQPVRSRTSATAGKTPDPATDSEDAEERTELLLQTQAASDRSTEPLSGRRRLTVAYAAPSPVWKSAYRIVLPRRSGGQTAAGESQQAQDGMLQAWAIVDNLSGEAWNGVELTLATGAPLTFALDLRGPRFVPRPDINGQLVTPAATGLLQGEASRATSRATAAQDSDGDRIPDSNDKCPFEPETYNGLEDEDGCPDRGRVIVSQAKLEILDNLFFPKDSARIQTQHTPMLDALAATLQHNPQLTLVEVQGHACGDSDPRTVSQSRADAVRSEMIRRGIPGARLRARGYGSDRPLRSGGTDEACERNRRVQFQIVQRRDEAEPAATAQASGTSSGISADRMAASARPLSTVQQNLGGTRYRIATPVSLPQGSSTMVALLTLRGGTEDIYLYRSDPNVPGSDRHLLRAARVHVGSALEPGPVAVFGDGGYIGEGVLGRVHAGETVVVPYALDSSARMQIEHRHSARPLRLVSLRGGEARVQEEALHETIYALQHEGGGSGDASPPARVFIRHPRRSGFEAIDLPMDSETSGDAYIIPQALGGGGNTQVTVRERRIDTWSRSLRGPHSEANLLCPYLDGTTAPIATRTKLALVCDGQRAILTAEQEADRLQRLRDELQARGDELRDNLRAIDKIASATALRGELLTKLAEHERKSAELQKQLITRREAQATAEAKLGQLLTEIVFEAAQ